MNRNAQKQHITGVHRAAAVVEILLATGVTDDGVCTGMGIKPEELEYLREVCERYRRQVDAAHRQLTDTERQQEDA
ncbi:hypothetical protein GCM10009805_14090 [Leucobacter chromiireducens subsp. solipictus]|uniref:Phage protein n=1 Tax=Leucobacter chromiireducens subsp. solipictus TaxID=398235 RepID=A0ABS1SG80_9MICO|nr:hypothetical protein [Leucobacter chromiireducens subsp. solipictus]